MRHKWLKLASLAQKTTCSLYTFSALVDYLLPKDNLLRTYLTSLQLVAAVKRLSVLHYSGYFIYLSFEFTNSTM